MIFEANRLIMREAAKNAARVAPSHAHADILSGILVEGSEDTGEIFMTATNHEVSIQQKIMASVERSGAMLVNARLLTDMMAKLEGDFVALSADSPNLLNVNGGKCAYQISCKPPKSYPKPVMPFPEESVLMSGICSLAKRTTFAVSTDEQKLALQCVQVKLKNNAVHAAACDGARMMLIKDAAEQTEEREFLLPGRSLQMLASISSDDDVFEVGDIGNEVAFVRGDMIFTIRKLNAGSFVDVAALIKNIKPAYSAVVEASGMKEALGIVSVGALAGETREPINMAFGEGEVIVRCDGDYSQGSTAVPANVTSQTPGAGFFYDVSALLKLFQVVGGRAKIELDSKGFMMIKTRSEVYCQGPMRPRAKKGKHVEEEKSAKGAKGVKKAA